MPKYPFAWSGHPYSGNLTPEALSDIILEKGKAPELQCPDEQCRIDNPDSRIIPVCCDPRDPCKALPAYFRMGPGHRHRQGCPFDEIAEQTDYILKHKAKVREEVMGHKADANFRDGFSDDSLSNLLQDIAGLDTSLLPDAFVVEYAPTTEHAEVMQEAARLVGKGLARKDAVRMARCKVLQKTGSLARVVAMRERLDELDIDGKCVPLAIPGRPQATFANAFFPVKKLVEKYTTPYILWGYAEISKIEEFFIIKYEYPLSRYSDDHPNLYAFTTISSKHCKAPLLRTLKSYAASRKICCVYSFSKHRLCTNTSCPDPALNFCVEIEPITSERVVIRERCIKIPEKRSA